MPAYSLPRPRTCIAAVAVVAALRLASAAVLPLSGDEAYHWEWSRALAGSYYDHPGMTAWLIALSCAVCGSSSELAVRLPAFASLTCAAAIAVGLARDLARTAAVAAALPVAASVAAAGWWAALLLFFVPLPAGLSVYMSTDPALMPAWLGALWALFAAVQRGHTRSWLCCGVCLGLAASTKFISLQLVGSVAVFLVATRAGRRWLRRPQPWLAFAAAVATATPMLWWNATHDWMTFRFNFDIRQRDQAASAWHPLVFVAGQAAILTPGLLFLGGAVLRPRALPALGLGLIAVRWCTVLPLAFFVCVSLRRKVGAHWTAAPWLAALVLVAVAVALRMPWLHASWARRSWRSSWLLIALFTAVTHAFVVLREPLAGLEVAQGQPRRVLRNLFGWPSIGQSIGAAVAELRAAPGSRGVFVMSNQYGTAAGLAFYTPGQPHVYLWSAARHHGRHYACVDDWSLRRGEDAVYVSKHALADWELPYLRQYFQAVAPIETVTIATEGAEQNAFYLVRCRGFDGRRPFTDP